MKKAKKNIVKLLALALVFVTMLSLTSCDVLQFVGDLTIKKQEVTDGSCWKYVGMQNCSYKNAEGEEDDYSAKLFSSAYNSKYAINIWETTAQNTMSAAGLYDYIECKNGELIRHHFTGIGDASLINGGSVYDTCEESLDVIGTYSGKDVDVIGKANTTLENVVKSYASEDMLVIRIEEEFESGSVFKGEFVFELMDDSDLDRYSRTYIKPAKD